MFGKVIECKAFQVSTGKKEIGCRLVIDRNPKPFILLIKFYYRNHSLEYEAFDHHLVGDPHDLSMDLNGEVSPYLREVISSPRFIEMLTARHYDPTLFQEGIPIYPTEKYQKYVNKKRLYSVLGGNA